MEEFLFRHLMEESQKLGQWRAELFSRKEKTNLVSMTRIEHSSRAGPAGVWKWVQWANPPQIQTIH